MTKIHLAPDLNTFFVDQVQNIAHKQGLKMTRHTMEYLGGVLARFGDTKNYLVRQTEGEKSKQNFPTLALMFLESCQTPANDQFFKLLQLGDVALFTSGYFGERVLRNSLDRDYYIAMGGMAYERAGQIRESLGDDQPSDQDRAMNIYFELSKSFKEFVEVFAELSDQSLLGNDKDILKLYEKWLASRNFRLARMLGEVGVIAGASPTESE